MRLFCLFLALLWPATALTQNQPMTFELTGSGGNCNGCDWVAAEGTITKETPAALRAFIKEHPWNFTVAFHSPGGNLFAGFEIGRILKEHGLNVTISKSVPIKDSAYSEEAPGICVSACAYAFLGGKVRFVEKQQLGFHQFSDPRANDDPDAALFTATDRIKDQLITGKIIEYLREMEIDLRLYEIAAEVLPSQIKLLNEEELRDLKIPTNFETPNSDWTLLPYENGLVAESQSAQTFFVPAGSRLRFYCSGDKHYLAYFSASDKSDKSETIDFLKNAYGYNKPTLNVGGSSAKSVFEGLFPSKDRTRFVILFRIDKSAAQRFAKTANLSADYNSGRAHEAAFARLDLGEIPGDKRALDLAMRNCIN